MAGVGLITALTVFASDAKKSVDNREVFPKVITTFVKQNIPDAKIIKFEHEEHKMEVKCSDNTKLCFNHHGECVRMKNEKEGLNSKLIAHLPASAVLYLKNNFNGVAVTEIEKKSYGFKVELRTSPNECEIWFNKDGSVKKECDY